MSKETKIILSPAGLLSEIIKTIGEIKGEVTYDRQHAIESHLRLCIRLCGYRPRETKESPATIAKLADQLSQCFKALENKLPEAQEELIRIHLETALSNLKAEAQLITVPPLKDIPEIVGLLILAFLLCLVPSARALDNFNVTNVLMSTLGVKSYPTNTQSTNLTVTGYTTNGAVITTNGFYSGQQTGGALYVKNFSPDGTAFVASWQANTNMTSTNTVWLLRSWVDHPPVVNLPNTNDWEQTPGIILAWSETPTNIGWWGTNLDPYALGNCTYLGIYAASNSGAGSTNQVLTNFFCGLQKNVKPRALTSGNF